MVEQRYQAVLAVISDGRSVTEVAGQWKVSRQTLHGWLARYEQAGLEGLPDRSHRPGRCPHQMAAAVEARVLEMRRARPFWGPRRIRVELGRAGVVPLPSESAVYRCLVRAGVIDPVRRQRRSEAFKRWERGAPMELWQLDAVRTAEGEIDPEVVRLLVAELVHGRPGLAVPQHGGDQGRRGVQRKPGRTPASWADLLQRGQAG